MRVIVFTGAVSGVLRIQTFHVICDGILTSEIFLTCSKHSAKMLARFLVCRAEVHIGGFANGWKGVDM